MCAEKHCGTEKRCGYFSVRHVKTKLPLTISGAPFALASARWNGAGQKLGDGRQVWEIPSSRRMSAPLWN